MKIKVISLKSSTDRKDYFSQHNQHLNYQFYDAVDGYELPEEIYYNQQIIKNVSNYTIGALGCALSHLNLWNEVIDTNEPMTIMEDDAIVRYDFYERQKELINSIGEWDLITWASNCDSLSSFSFNVEHMPFWFHVNETYFLKSLNNFQKSTDKNILLKLKMFFGTSCYSISPNGAKKYKQACFPFKQKWYIEPKLNNEKFLAAGLDGSMCFHHEKMNSFYCFPSLSVNENNQKTSTVMLNQ